MSRYHQTQIFLAEKGNLQVSHYVFKKGLLLASKDADLIVKPEAYLTWQSKRKETFLAGRLAVRHAQECLNLPTINIPKASDGSPNWPADYLGSISHTDSQAVAVLLLGSRQGVQGVGIDIEEASKAHLLEDDEIIGKALEFQLLFELGIDTEQARLLLFSLKESIYKALYPVVGTYFDFLDVVLIDIKEGALCFQVLRDLSETVQKGFVIRGHFSYEGNQLLTWAYW